MNSSSVSRVSPVFSFLQINDTHYQSPQLQPAPRNFHLANNRAHWLLDAIRGGDVFPKVDFLIHVGDMVNTEQESELLKFKQLLDGLNLPYYTVVGNHDNGSGEGQTEKETAYRKIFGDRFHYTFTHKGLGFVIVNNSGTATPDLATTAVEERDRKFIEHLELHHDRPVIVACHVPIVAMREEGALIESFGLTTYKVAEPGMAQILQTHHHHVAAVISGHVHLSGVVHEYDIAHIGVAGTAGFPHDVALHTVYPDALETRFISLPSDILEPTTNIHKSPTTGLDATDATHTDYMSYLRGNANERFVRTPFKIPLRD